MSQSNSSTPIDIDIQGSHGFYTLQGLSMQGREFINTRVAGGEEGIAYSDQRDLTEAIADGAIDDDLEVTVDGQRYLGNGLVAS